MGLCLICGDGGVAKYAAKVSESNATVDCVFGLKSTDPWLADHPKWIGSASTLEFRRIAERILDNKCDKVVILGKPFKSIELTKFGPVTIHYVFSKSRSWKIPQAFLGGLIHYLRDMEIELVHPRRVFPELFALQRTIIGKPKIPNPEMELYSAILASSVQNWKFQQQSFIVNERRVISSEARNTDELIDDFRVNWPRGTFDAPILCKVSIPEFRKIDAPTIGIQTVKAAFEAGLIGIVSETKNTIIMQLEEIRTFCDQNDFCVYLIDYSTA